jgi:hypothetical protein
MVKSQTPQGGIVAIFPYLDQFCHAVAQVAGDKEFSGHEVLSPVSYHELMALAEEQYGPSQVRWFTLTGALTGMVTGFGMCLWMDYDWPIVVGGKSPGIYSLPAYVIFGFELMVLFGALATILGMLVMGRLPNPYGTVLDPRITDDRFAIFVPAVGVESAQAKLLQTLGAAEVFQAPL